MSRRTLQHPIARLAKAQSRMAPGGIRWSESPIPGRYSPRVPMVGGDAEPEPPVDTPNSWWWKLDDPGPDLYEVGGGPPFVPATDTGIMDAAPPTYQAAPVAPGSTSSLQLNPYSSIDIPQIEFTAPNTDWATVDFWIAGLAPNTNRLLIWKGATSVAHYEITFEGAGGKLRFWSLYLRDYLDGGDGVGSIVDLDSWPDPMHLQWGIRADAESLIRVNGTTVSHTFNTYPWPGSPKRADVTLLHPGGPETVPDPGDPIRVDEVRVYDTAPIGV